MNDSLLTRLACTNLCSVTVMKSSVTCDESKLRWMCFSVKSVCFRWCCSAGWVLGSKTGGQRWKVYMANKASSGLSAFLRLGVPCDAPGLPLGGAGRLGAISAALARSSRNLSNSGSEGARGCEYKRRGDEYTAETKQNVDLPSLVTPSSPSSPFY